MSVIRGLLFLAVFVVDVRVKAENLKIPQSKEIQAQPENCWSSEGPCAIRTLKSQGARFNWQGGALALDESTTLARVANGDLRLISGTIWLRGAQLTRVVSEFGTLEIPAQGEAWITKDADQMSVSEVVKTALIRPQGSADVLEVQSGLRNWLGRVGTDGRATTGVPIAIALQPFLKKWAKLYPGTRRQFESEALLFYPAWSEASRIAAEIHQSLFERKCASIETEEMDKIQTRRKVEARNRVLLQMFRHHVFDE